MTVMKTIERARAMLASVLLVAPILVGAHHSIAAFDLNAKKTITGTVSDVKWVNPHVFVFIEVPGEGGAATRWSILSGTPTLNVRNGWKYGDVKKGDRVTVEINPARDPNVHSGSMRRITLPDGRVVAGPREFLVVPQQEAPKKEVKDR